jgi:hypothetical protein
MSMRSFLCLTLMLGAVACLPARAASIATGWDRIAIAPMKTSIYVGSVSLTTEVLVRSGSTLSSTYEAKVRPWFFWGETGKIAITLSDAALANLSRGERAEFTGEASNHKNKPRTVTGYAQPADATSGKIKVRIMADGIELIFNGTYQFEASAK